MRREGLRRPGIVVVALLSSCLPQRDADENDDEIGSSGEERCEEPGCGCPVWYDDEDHDGFGDPASGRVDCSEAPPGLVLNAQDCFDGSADAFPGQLGAFVVDRGDGSFDYDCDGLESLEFDREATCQAWPTCEPESIAGAGWVGSFPECGGPGTWMHDCDYRIGWDTCKPEVYHDAEARCR